jgi:hypothetical protein
MKKLLRTLAIVAGVITAAMPGAHAEPVHVIAMHGEPALPAGFTHLPYVNPDAPKGGKVTYGVVGTFDSVRPFIVKSMRTTARGLADPVFGNLIYETLMQRSQDEPFTLYGLLAERWNGTRSAVSSNTISIRLHAGRMASRSPPTTSSSPWNCSGTRGGRPSAPVSTGSKDGESLGPLGAVHLQRDIQPRISADPVAVAGSAETRDRRRDVRPVDAQPGDRLGSLLISEDQARRTDHLHSAGRLLGKGPADQTRHRQL